MQDYLAKLYEKVRFPGVIFKYMKKIGNGTIFGKMVSQFSSQE